MKLESMTFRDGPDGDRIPATVTVVMTVEEAAFFATVSGMLRDCDKPDNFSAYDCLAEDVFDRYWDNGVDGAMKDLAVPMPMVNTMNQ